jgi:hypothetical protein
LAVNYDLEFDVGDMEEGPTKMKGAAKEKKPIFSKK